MSIIKLLLQAKADVNAKTKDNRTCLHVASRMGHTGNTDIVKELLNYGAEVNVQTLVRGMIDKKDPFKVMLYFSGYLINVDMDKTLISYL